MFASIPNLRCGTILVRALRRSDQAAWLDLRSRNRAWLRPWEATEPPGPPVPSVPFAALVRQDRRLWRQRRALNAVIESDGVLVGRVCLSGIEWGSSRTSSLGYWIGQEHAGQGIVPCAAALLTNFAFRTGIHRVEIATRPENEQSLKVVWKLGFRDEGIRARALYVDGDWRDHRIFALTATERRVGEWWDCAHVRSRAPHQD